MTKFGVTSFLRGIGLKNIRAAYYGWFFNFLFSIFVYWGYFRVFDQAAGKSLLAFDGGSEVGMFTFFMDINHRYPGSLGLVFSLACVGAILYFLLTIFLAGGIFGTLVEDERTSFTNLLALSLEYYFDMIKMFFANLLGVLVVLFVPIIILVLFVSSDHLMDSEKAIQIFLYTWVPLVVFVLLVSSFIYDFSRIYKIKDGKNLITAFRSGIRFTFTNKRSILTILLLYGLALLILYMFNYLFILFTQNFLFTTLFFLILQAFVWLRYYLKIVLIRAEIHLARAAENPLTTE